GRVDLWIDVGRRGSDLRRRADRHRLSEGDAAVAGDGEPHLGSAAVAVEDRPRRVDVVLIGAAEDVVDRDPLLVLDVAGLASRGVVRRVERSAAVTLDPVLAQRVAYTPVDRAGRV